MNPSSQTDPPSTSSIPLPGSSQLPWKKTLLAVLVFLALTAAFWFMPYQLGDDWDIYHEAATRMLHGIPFYGTDLIHGNYYYNPPWMAVALLPVGVLPTKVGWSIMAVLTLLCLLLLARRFELRPAKLALLALSPPVLYTILHGQVDVLLLAAFLLPSEWRPIVALTKPQVTLALLFGAELKNWKRTLLVTGGIAALSFALFGNWLVPLLQQPRPFITSGHNYFLGLWPMLVPVAVGLVLIGMRRKDLRWLMAASPFFSPYVATSSLAGVWFAACSALTTWQAALVLVSWWAAILYHGFA
jgi:hypothetical protein